MNQFSYIDNVSSILQHASFPASLATGMLTRSNRAGMLAAAYPSQAQLEAISRVQAQLAAMNVSTANIAEWSRMIQRFDNPVQHVLSALQAIDQTQLQAFSQTLCSQQMAMAIAPAFDYLEREHFDVYREVVSDTPSQPTPSARPKQKKKIRWRALGKAMRLIGRANVALLRLDDRLRSLPSGKLSNILSLLLSISSIAPPKYARSIGLLCFAIAVILAFHHKDE